MRSLLSEIICETLQKTFNWSVTPDIKSCVVQRDRILMQLISSHLFDLFFKVGIIVVRNHLCESDLLSSSLKGIEVIVSY